MAVALLAEAWAQLLATQAGVSATPGLAPRWADPAQALACWVLPEFDRRRCIVHQRPAQGNRSAIRSAT